MVGHVVFYGDAFEAWLLTGLALRGSSVLLLVFRLLQADHDPFAPYVYCLLHPTSFQLLLDELVAVHLRLDQGLNLRLFLGSLFASARLFSFVVSDCLDFRRADYPSILLG